MFQIMPTEAAMLDELDHRIGSAINEAFEVMPVSQDGTIVGGSYDQKSGTAEMLFGDTYCILGDGGPGDDSYINHQKLPLFTPAIGFLYGPTGDERAVAIPTPAGYALLFKHGEDDTPAPAQGELYILHKSVASQGQPAAVWDAGHRLTNDGPTPGDGLGGTYVGHMGALTQAETASGHTVSLNDATQTIQVQSANGLLGYWDDANQVIAHIATVGALGVVHLGSIIDLGGELTGTVNSIQHIVPTGGMIGLGKYLTALDPVANAVTRQTDVNDAITNQITKLIGNSHIQLLTAFIANGGPVGAAATAVLADLSSSGFPSPSSWFTLLPDLHGITIPGCSQTVLAH